MNFDVVTAAPGKSYLTSFSLQKMSAMWRLGCTGVLASLL
jgi:hypothetical protein